MAVERSWGVSPVPQRLRTLSGLDVGLLWGNLGISLLVLVAGTFLAGLGLRKALLATVVGAILGTALLGLAGLIGAERRVPGMVLLREEHPAVDQQQLAGVLQRGHVAADVAEATERDDPHRVIRQQRRALQTTRGHGRQGYTSGTLRQLDDMGGHP